MVQTFAHPQFVPRFPNKSNQLLIYPNLGISQNELFEVPSLPMLVRFDLMLREPTSISLPFCCSTEP